MPEQNSGSAGSQVDWGVVGSMVGVVFEGIGTVVSASNQNSTITTASGESYTVTNDGSGGYQASPTAGAGAGNGNGNGNGNPGITSRGVTRLPSATSYARSHAVRAAGLSLI